MFNWSTDEKKFRKESPEQYKLWRMIQLVNYGLDREKLDKEEIKKAWPKIKKRLDPYKKRLMEYYLWGKRYSLPNNLIFWNLSKTNRK